MVNVFAMEQQGIPFNNADSAERVAAQSEPSKEKKEPVFDWERDKDEYIVLCDELAHITYICRDTSDAHCPGYIEYTVFEVTEWAGVDSEFVPTAIEYSFQCAYVGGRMEIFCKNKSYAVPSMKGYIRVIAELYELLLEKDAATT